MKIINKQRILVFVALVLLFVLTSCGCSGNKTVNYSQVAKDLSVVQLDEIKKQVGKVYDEQELGATDKNNAILTISANFDKDEEGSTKKVIKEALTNVIGEEELDSKVNELYVIILNVLKTEAIIQLSEFYDAEKLDRHQVEYCNKEKSSTEELINASLFIDGAVDEKNNVSDSSNLYQILSNYYLNIQTLKNQQGPIRVYSFKQDGFWKALFNNVLVFPIGWLMQAVSQLFGGYYFLGILIITILIRTLLMPVYNSTNDMTLKQQLAAPDLKKLEEKYATKKDPDSQRAKQMEQAQIYRKFKMGLGGCLPMFFQLPVFIAVYNAVSRMRFTDGTILNSPSWALELKTKVFGVDLFLNRGAFNTLQFWGIIVILILVVGTQIFQQIMTQKIQKWNYMKAQEDIPAYKRQAYQQNQTGNSMKFMMYFMIVMMGIFVFQSAAALGVYWLIGNIYSIAQMFINYKLAPKRLAKLKKKLKVE